MPYEQFSPETPDDDQKKLAEAWQERYSLRLDDFYKQEHPVLDQLIDIIWEEAVLGRISPVNAQEKEVRQALEKTVWPGDRNDPTLYWRLIYSIASSKEAIDRGYSIAASGSSLIVGAYQAVYQAYLTQKSTELFGEQNPQLTILDEIAKRAKEKLQELGVTPPDRLVPIGASGIWKGIPVKVGQYLEDGRVWLEAVNYEDRMRLYDAGASQGVEPEELDIDNFTVETENNSALA